MTAPTTSTSLPPEVIALGEPVVLFHGSRVLSAVSLILGPLMLLIFPGVAVAGYATGGFQEGSPAGPIMVVLAVVMAAGGAYLIYAGLAISQLRYAVCPGGVARIRGKRADILGWDGLQINVRFHGHPILALLGTSNRFWIKNGPKRWAIHYEVANSDRLAEAVSKEIARRGLEPALERIGRGEALKLGPVTIHRGGLMLNDRILSWEELASVGDVLGPTAGGVGRRFTIKQADSDREWGS